MVGHSPIARFDATFCGASIVSKTDHESAIFLNEFGQQGASTNRSIVQQPKSFSVSPMAQFLLYESACR
jgi:hypothetical protein